MEHAVTKEMTIDEWEENDVKVFGFWVYLMTDLVLFACLFACYVVLRTATFGGPSGHELFEMQGVLAETVVLLVSSFTCALGTLAILKNQRHWAALWFLITFALGITFLVLELTEFAKFRSEGAGWERSAFLTSFFTLVGTHGFHITCGLIWMGVMIVRILARPLADATISRIIRMSHFWHFLDFVWIFIFTVVYGMGYLL